MIDGKVILKNGQMVGNGISGGDAVESLTAILEIERAKVEEERKKIDAGILMHRAAIAKFLVKRMERAPESDRVARGAYEAAIAFLVDVMNGEPL